jgi:hypothetical protein
MELKVGDLIVQQFGPYEATATVVEIKQQGAVLEYDALARLVGFPDTVEAPDGTQLTEDRAHGFLGRAHWAAAQVVPT